MKTKIFSNGLVVKHRKSAIIFEQNVQDGLMKFKATFTADEFKEFVSYIEQVASEAWKDITPKETNSMGSDYYEYYDRQYDNNGYLSFKGLTLVLEGPHNSANKLYQFNKAKIQSFIYDLKVKINKLDENI